LSEPVRSIATFELERELGRGGMGVVWLARDVRLGRHVAVKMLRETDDRVGRERFLREARAAASINHPNVCQIHEVGEEAGVLYIAMELLEGDTLAARLVGGALSLDESVPVLVDVLAALDVIHARKLVHRDVKPSNIFLTPHGAKLLDFGLARPGSGTDDTRLALTGTGTALGTPRYMAPEQWTGSDVGPGTDLWAVGVILYEMLSGRPAFDGASIGELCDAIVHREPPALGGGPSIVAADRVVQRALEKRPADRFASAGAMSDAVKAAALRHEAPEPARARRTTRLIVLPFRILPPDPAIDFLSVSLPDAISGALASVDSLVVRSRLSATGVTADTEIRTIAREAGVDAVVTGSLLRSGDRVRVATQLVEAPGGTVKWSRSVDGTLGDLFALQDSVAHAILEPLTVSLPAAERGRLEHAAPVDPRAYELYLRGNDIAVSWVQESRLIAARDLYRSSLDAQNDFAPAWARIARVYRVMSKYGHGDTEENYRLGREAIARALELDPDLPLAHSYLTNFQVEDGEALVAVRRLVSRARTRGSDPEVFAGLVVALRFCGLLEESRAAHDRARRLDPRIRTGVTYTDFALGAYERAIENDDETPSTCRLLSLDCVGRTDEALAGWRAELAHGHEGLEAMAVEMTLAAMEGDRVRVRRISDAMAGSSFRDPEGWFFLMRNLARVGEVELALERLERIVGSGYLCHRLMEHDPWLASLRSEPELYEILDRTRAQSEAAGAEFARLGGRDVLGIASP
jgi:eukaryotic-like serine/threonine-protein kinase